MFHRASFSPSGILLIIGRTFCDDSWSYVAANEGQFMTIDFSFQIKVADKTITAKIFLLTKYNYNNRLSIP